MLATDLVRRQVDVLVATDSSAALAAKSATATIPIVYQGGADPCCVAGSTAGTSPSKRPCVGTMETLVPDPDRAS